MKIEQSYFQTLRNNLNKLSVQFGFLRRGKPLFRQINFALQFFCIFTFKASLFSMAYNESIHHLSNEIVGLFTNNIFLGVLNFTMLIPLMLFIFWNVLSIRQESRYEFHLSYLSPINIKALAIHSMFLIEIIKVPCAVVSVRQVYLAFTDPQNHLNISLLVLTCISLGFSCISILLDSYGMLLGHLTVPIIICLIGPKWNIILLSGAGFLLVLSRLSLNRSFESSTNRLATVCKFLLAFIFGLDVFTPSISNLFFILYLLVISLILIVSPEPDFIEDNIQLNNFLLNALDEMKKNKEINKDTNYNILKEIFRYERHSRNGGKAREPFQPTHPLTYENLSQFFKIKIEEDIENFKKQTTYKLQLFLFEVKHNIISFQMLSEISQFSEKTKNTFKIDQQILMLEVQHQVDKNIEKKEGSFNLDKIISVCTKIEITNEHLDHILNTLIKFWSLLEKGELSSRQFFEIMKLVENKQEKMKETVKILEQYPNLGTQTKLYNYSLKLINFQYGSQQNVQPLASINYLSSTYYIILSQGKIKNVSNQLLLELRKKKHQIINSPLQSLIPEGIYRFVERQFSENFQTSQKITRVIPFFDIKNKILPFHVNLDTIFSVESGIQQVINFVQSNDLQELPLFFYEASTDKILFSNQLFSTYFKSKEILIDNNTMGFDLFTSDFFSLVSKDNLKVGDSFSSPVVSHTRNHILNQSITLKIVQIFQDQKDKLILLVIESNEHIKYLLENSIFSTKEFLKKKNNSQQTLLHIEAIKSGSEQTQNFCPILNPYESHIDQSMIKLKMNWRMTYLKILCILAIIIICSLVALIMFMTFQIKQMDSEVINTFEKAKKKTAAVDSCYEMFYLYYRYYQIKYYPEHLLRVSNYDIPFLQRIYKIITNSNLTVVLKSTIKEFHMQKKNYTMLYNHYNQTKTTSPVSIIDFLTDIKYALESNNPQFSVRNQHNIDIIVSAYINTNLEYLKDKQNIILYGSIIGVLFQFIMAILMKILTFILKSFTKDITSILDKMPLSDIKKQISQYKELRMVTQFSDPSLEIKTYNQDELIYEKIEINGENNKQNERIRRKSMLSFLSQNNNIILLIAGSALFVVWMQVQLTNYNRNTNRVLEKYFFLLNDGVNITKPSEKFYQAAMEQFLPIDQRILPSAFPFYKAEGDRASLTLPNYFKEYQILEDMLFEKKLCQTAIVFSFQIYARLNCSLVLDGIMQKSYSEVFVQYTQLAMKYTGTKMSKLGQTYRIGAAYPVYMEIAFLRRNLNIIILRLKENFQSKIAGFVKSEGSNIMFVVYSLIYYMLVVVILMALEFKRLRDEAKATIRVFKMIPKEYLLKMKVTKYIKNMKILEKMESF